MKKISATTNSVYRVIKVHGRVCFLSKCYFNDDVGSIVTCMCFLEYKKAFDRWQDGKMMTILKKLKLIWKNKINNEFILRTLNCKRNGWTSSHFVETYRRLRQGCVLSLLLFNLYSERIFREHLTKIILSSRQWRDN